MEHDLNDIKQAKEHFKKVFARFLTAYNVAVGIGKNDDGNFTIEVRPQSDPGDIFPKTFDNFLVNVVIVGHIKTQ